MIFTCPASPFRVTIYREKDIIALGMDLGELRFMKDLAFPVAFVSPRRVSPPAQRYPHHIEIFD